jgi:hypothetical protein
MLKALGGFVATGGVGAVTYEGTWNASTNTPTLASGTGTKGGYYVVNVAGSTNLDGITDWQIGDWAIFNGTVWEKVDNTESVVSVNGLQGVVVLPTMSNQDANNVAITGGTVVVSEITAANVTVTANLYANLTTSSTATFATSSLPLIPEGYIEIELNGATKKIPFYGV